MRKKIIILGVTGSIGKETLDTIREYPDTFEISAVSAHKNEDYLLKISKEFKIPVLALSGKKPKSSEITYSSRSGIMHMISDTEADIVVNGIAGSAGLLPSVATLRSGKDLALANKETIVMAGKLIMNLAEEHSSKVIPVDSEHSAIFTLLESIGRNNVSEIILTASGGPFRTTPLDQFDDITLEDALKHPTWKMGKKITVDSATMANKGLEVIEAHKLFNMPADKITVLIHPESRIHSLIRTNDMCMYAQISKPDMRGPIGSALFYPKPMTSSFGNLDLTDQSLTFFHPEYERYPLLKIAYETIEKEGAYPLVYNAANEIAVEYFMNKQIRFTKIAEIVSELLQADWGENSDTFEEIIETDSRARTMTIKIVEKQIRK